jgi:hypothetical protein
LLATIVGGVPKLESLHVKVVPEIEAAPPTPFVTKLYGLTLVTINPLKLTVPEPEATAAVILLAVPASPPDAPG